MKPNPQKQQRPENVRRRHIVEPDKECVQEVPHFIVKRTPVQCSAQIVPRQAASSARTLTRHGVFRKYSQH